MTILDREEEQFGQRTILQRVISNFGWSIVSELGGKGLYFIINIYLARHLSVKYYGVFSLAQTVVSYFWFAVDLGINMYGCREIARQRRSFLSQIIDPLLTMRLFSGLLVFLIFVIIVFFYIDISIQKRIFVGCAFYLVARATNIEWIYRGLERFEYIALGNFTTFISMILLMSIWVRDSKDVVKASYIWSGCYLLGCGVLLFLLYKKINYFYKPLIKFSLWLSHLKESIYFAISAGLMNLYTYLPIIYLGIYGSKYELGLFVAAHKLVIVITFLITVFQMALYPVFSELYILNKYNFKKIYNSLIFFSIFIGLFVGLIITVFGEKIVVFLYGEKYIKSYYILSIIVWFASLASIRGLFSVGLAVSGLQKYYMVASIFGSLFLSFIFFISKLIFNVSILVSVSFSFVLTELIIVVLLIIFWKIKI